MLMKQVLQMICLIAKYWTVQLLFTHFNQPVPSYLRVFNYANNIFIPHILYHLQLSKRVDIVWDSYISGSLKECMREKRGSGVRRNVSSHVKIPSNWMAFLRDPTNKSELFQVLSYKISVFDFPPNKIVCITSGLV